MEIIPNSTFSPPTEGGSKSNSTYAILVLSAITIGLAAYAIISKNLEKKKDEKI